MAKDGEVKGLRSVLTAECPLPPHLCTCEHPPTNIHSHTEIQTERGILLDYNLKSTESEESMGLIRITYRLKHISFRGLGCQPLAVWSTDNRFFPVLLSVIVRVSLLIFLPTLLPNVSASGLDITGISSALLGDVQPFTFSHRSPDGLRHSQD